MARAIAIATETTLENINISKTPNGEKDFNQHDLSLAVDTPGRNRRVVEGYLKYAKGKRGICFAVTVEHAQALSDAFSDAHVPSVVVSGSTPIHIRKQLYASLKSGELKMICNVEVLTEGFNVKMIEVVMMARPTQSWSLYIQCIGRGLRVCDGKEECLIIDITDNCKKHKLVPQNLSRAIGIDVKHEETIEEALVRAEQREQEARVRKLTEKRVSDFHVNMFETIEWKENKESGVFVIEVGASNHRIALIPCKGDPDLYEVHARLYPDRPGCKSQKWADAQELQFAQMFAERKVKQLHDKPSDVDLLDKNVGWRKEPVTEAQKKKMKYHHIEYKPGMSKGDASDLINTHLAGVARRKAEREARKEAKRQEAYA